MIDMVKRLEVQVLRRAGHTQEETARLIGVSPSTVCRVEGESAVATLDSGAERKRRQIGRLSKAEPFRQFLSAELIKDPHVMALGLLRRAGGQGYSGGKSALYVLVKGLRPERPRPIVRISRPLLCCRSPRWGRW